jgi:hypothetical protein
MPDPLQPADAPSNPAADRFYGAALDRIRRIMLVIGFVATGAATFVFGWKTGAGVLLGCTVAWANFVWLKQAIGAVADRVSPFGRRQSSASTVAKFLLRYALIAIGAYAIFLSSRESLYGFLGGLFLAVAAILCEAAYEAFVALRRGF